MKENYQPLIKKVIWYMQMMACIFVFTVRDFLSDYEYYMIAR
jgi:hypothetical protein